MGDPQVETNATAIRIASAAPTPAAILTPNITACSAIVHIVDGVLVPTELQGLAIRG
jgi:hypothetical protein